MFIEIPVQIEQTDKMGVGLETTEELYFATINITHIVYFMPVPQKSDRCNMMLPGGGVMTVFDSYERVQERITQAQQQMNGGMVITLRTDEDDKTDEA